MIHLETKVKIPFLWGKNSFSKSEWQQVNLIVGPNGSGKSLLAEEISRQFKNAGYNVTFLHADRGNQDEVIEILKKDDEVKIQIENVLSNMFGKTIRFEQDDDGNFIPLVVNKNQGVEYNLRQGECHGLREILTLLVSLYSTKSGCLFVDEPELHLHPQFQQFFINEIKKVAASDPKRIFFLITHSPYFIDLRFAEDLLGVVVCHVNKIPTFIDYLSEKDESFFSRFLPRFNTYHKQFFFSDNQIFVEGYTDQQMFTNLLCTVENHFGVAGTSVIDVGGKDELGVFFKVCSLLGTDARIITDLDALFCGKLRDVVCEDDRPQSWLDSQFEKQKPFYLSLFTSKEMQTPINLEKLIFRLERYLVAIGKHVFDIDYSVNPEIDLYSDKIKALYSKYEKPEGLDTFKTVVLMGILNLNEKLQDILPVPLASTIPLIINLSNYILAAVESSRVYILPRGCIEHFYTQSNIQYMPVSGKDKLFHNELEFMIEETPEELRHQYPELTSILNRATNREHK